MPKAISQLLFLPIYRILSFVKNDDIYDQALQHWIEIYKKKFPVFEFYKVHFEELTEFYSENRDKFNPNNVLIIGHEKVLNFPFRQNFQILAGLFGQVIYENSFPKGTNLNKIIKLNLKNISSFKIKIMNQK